MLAVPATMAQRPHSTAPQQPLEPRFGTVVHVHDGDSFHFLDENGQRSRIRISGIDAPELGQAYGPEARAFLKDLIQNTRVRLEPVKLDAFGRTVARIYVLNDATAPREERNVADAMLEAGLAWHFTRYRADQTAAELTRYHHAQERARAAFLGLWHDPQALPPWRFRTLERPQSSRTGIVSCPAWLKHTDCVARSRKERSPQPPTHSDSPRSPALE